MPEDFAVDTGALTGLGNTLGEVATALRDNKSGDAAGGVVMGGFKSQDACQRLAEVLDQADADLAERFEWNADLAHEHSRNYGDVEEALAQRIKQVQDRVDQAGGS